MGKMKNKWIEAYNEGNEIEQSRDDINWFDLNHEPFAGSGYFYREKQNNVTPIHQSDDPILPPDIII